MEELQQLCAGVNVYISREFWAHPSPRIQRRADCANLCFSLESLFVEMVQSSKLKSRKSAKTDKRNRQKAAGHNKARVGLKKEAKKAGAGRGDTTNRKMNKKLVRSVPFFLSFSLPSHTWALDGSHHVAH